MLTSTAWWKNSESTSSNNDENPCLGEELYRRRHLPKWISAWNIYQTKVKIACPLSPLSGKIPNSMRYHKIALHLQNRFLEYPKFQNYMDFEIYRFDIVVSQTVWSAFILSDFYVICRFYCIISGHAVYKNRQVLFVWIFLWVLGLMSIDTIVVKL